MCQFAPLPGFYGNVISLPTSDFMPAWFLLLIPFILPIWLYITRPITDAIALPCLRLPKPSMKLPGIWWFLTRSALLMIACSILTFVVIPSDFASRRWFTDQQATIRPKCLSALDSLNSTHTSIGGVVFMLGVMAPFLVVMIREFTSRYSSHA